MATIARVFGPESDATIVGFGSRPLGFPVRPGRLLRWGFFALILANVGRIPILSRGDSDVAIVANDVFVSVIALLAILVAVPRRSLKLDRVCLAVLAFALIGFLSAVASKSTYALSGFELFISLSYLARWLTYFGVYLFIINNVDFEQVEGIWKALSAAILVFTVFGVLQSIFLPGFAQMVYPSSRDYIDWDPQGQRLVSTVLDPNIAGGMILIVLLVILGQISSGMRAPWWQPALLLLGLAMTVSRSALLALCVGLVVIVIARGISARLVRVLGLIGFLSIAIIPRLINFAQTYARFDIGTGSSASTRIFAWLLALRTIADHPVFGVGFNTYGYVKQRSGVDLIGHAAYGSDGGLLFVAVVSGFVGLAAYLAILLGVLRNCRRVWRDASMSPSLRGLAIGAAAGSVAIIVQSVFANSMFTTFVMEMSWVIWGLIAVVARRSATRTNDPLPVVL